MLKSIKKLKKRSKIPRKQTKLHEQSETRPSHTNVKVSISQNRLHDSFGLSNLQKRTEHLKKIQQHEIGIDIIEVKEPDGTVTGTRATVTIRLG